MIVLIFNQVEKLYKILVSKWATCTKYITKGAVKEYMHEETNLTELVTRKWNVSKRVCSNTYPYKLFIRQDFQKKNKSPSLLNLTKQNVCISMGKRTSFLLD